MAIGNTGRIAAGLVVVAVVVALNVNRASHRAGPAVLGTKVTRCSVDTRRIATGVRAVRAQQLSVTVRDGKPGGVLIPPLKVGPGTPAPDIAPVSIELGVTSAGKGRMSALTVVRNSTDCPIAITAVRVSARQGTAAATQSLVVFGGRERVVIAPGRDVRGRTMLPAGRDGTWLVDATGSADIGASA